LIEFRSVTFGYPGAESAVIARASFKLAAGEFALVCGPTGSGKSTLLKLLNGLAPHFTGGNLSGEIWIDGRNVSGAKPHELAEMVGYVNQQPEGSFVADSVGEEIAYGLEQLGFAPAEMERLVSEHASLVGVAHLLAQPLASLSGGQQQRVAIAAAMAAGQRVLVLDEPTSALDAGTAAELVALLARLAKERGITILLAEHRLERVLEQIDSVIVVNGDATVVKSEPREAFKDYRLLPPVVELSKRLGLSPIALSIDEAKKAISNRIPFAALPKTDRGEVALSVNNISIQYGSQIAVSEVSLEVCAGEVVALMGANGSGKSSLLWAIQGTGRRSQGSVWTAAGDPADLTADERLGVVTLVPQRASDLLFLNTLTEELDESDRFNGVEPGETAKQFLVLSNRTDPKQHPRDLSAGQQLALVLAVQLVKGSSLVLLDEPTRGLDYEAKRHLVAAIKLVQSTGRAVLVASHDIEFVAQISDRVVVLEAGSVSAEGATQEVLGPGGLLPTQVALIGSQKGLLLAEQVGGEHAN
jgi:energy-coupling factor transport system ATP-binding protein